MNQFAGLPLHGGHPVRVAMAQRAHRDAGGEVEVGLALVIPHLRAPAADERKRSPGVILQHVRVVEIRGAGANDRGNSHGILEF